MADLHVKGSLNICFVHVSVNNDGDGVHRGHAAWIIYYLYNCLFPKPKIFSEKKWLGLAKQYGMETNIFDTA